MIKELKRDKVHYFLKLFLDFMHNDFNASFSEYTADPISVCYGTSLATLYYCYSTANL